MLKKETKLFMWNFLRYITNNEAKSRHEEVFDGIFWIIETLRICRNFSASPRSETGGNRLEEPRRRRHWGGAKAYWGTGLLPLIIF
jgi:hypothetical protein